MSNQNKAASAAPDFESGKNRIILVGKADEGNAWDSWDRRDRSLIRTFSLKSGKLEKIDLSKAEILYKDGSDWLRHLNSDIAKHSRLMKTWNELSDFVHASKEARAQASYSVYCRSDEMICFRLNSSMQAEKVEFAYVFENPGVAGLLNDILKFPNEDKDEFGAGKKIFCDQQNHYQFIANPDILDLALCVRSDEANGIPISHEFKLRCKNGKVRDIIAPSDDVKVILQSINKTLQSVYDRRNSDFQVAYKPKKSIKDNAKAHIGNQFMFKLDLHDFFPSCKEARVDKYVAFLFKNCVGADALKKEFMKAVLHDGALYIGNPVSGTLANTIISAPVRYIKRICSKFNIQFTVYADDMTFSSSKYLSKEFVTSIFDRAFVKYDMERDFCLNDKKSFGLSKNNREVTGVVINGSDKMTCHRYIYSNIRQTLHQLSYGDESHFVRPDLVGHIAFMMSVDDSGKLRNLVNKYEATIRKYGLISDDNIAKIKAA